MLVSYLVRLVDSSRTSGDFVGEVERVETGERTIVSGVQELLDALRPVADGQATNPHEAEARPGEGEVR